MAKASEARDFHFPSFFGKTYVSQPSFFLKKSEKGPFDFPHVVALTAALSKEEEEEEEEEDGRPPQGKRGRDKKVTIETSCRGGIKEEGLLI